MPKRLWLNRLEDSARPESEFTLAAELEHISMNRDYKPTTIDGDCGMSQLFENMCREKSCMGEQLNGFTYGIQGKFGNVTLEPGSQLELSTPPRKTLLEIESDLEAFKSLFFEHSEGQIHLIALALNPLYSAKDLPILPKPRYRLMDRHFRRHGSHGPEMMRATASVQVCLDFSSLEDLSRRMRLSLKLLPFLRALFAASPIFAGRDTGYETYRHHIWLNTDPGRTGCFPALHFDESSVEDWLECMFNMPPMFVDTAQGYQASSSVNLHEAVPNLLDREDGLQTLDLHISQCFAEIRFKQWMEIRTPDLCPPPYRFASAALLKGLFYCPKALDEVETILTEISYHDTLQLWNQLAHRGLDTPIQNYTARSVAEQILKSAYEGLQRQRPEECSYLDEFCNLILEDRFSVAGWLRRCYSRDCGGSALKLAQMFTI